MNEVVEIGGIEMLSLGFRLQPALSHRLLQTVKLTLSEKLAVYQMQINHQLDLIEAVRGVLYQPSATCPKCNNHLTSFEIVDGFNTDPADYTTSCPKCRFRFPPKLKAGFDNAMTIELPFYCDVQSLAQLRGMETLDPETLRTKHQAIYHSVIIHHGSLRRAFLKNGVQYVYESVPNWQEKVNKFLGKLPDPVIAGYVDQSVRTIRNLRNRLGIKSYSTKSAREEVVADY